MEVKKVGTESIQLIQSIAQVTWPHTFKNILTEAQVSYMLDLFYSNTALHAQIKEQGHQFILASIDEIPTGFASYGVKSKDEDTIYKLYKIYIHFNHQRKGIGQILLNYILSDIKSAGAKSLELHVNRYNKALGFYQKLGFKIIDQQDFPIGNGYFMNDYIMKFSW